MAVPEFKAFLLPTLEWYGDDKEHKLAELDAPLSDHFGFSEEDRTEMLESGTQTRLHNRVAWAHVYLAKAKLLDRIARSRHRITDRGQQLLASKPAEITPAFPRDTYPEFKEFAIPTKPAGEPEPGTAVGDDSTATPEERLEWGLGLRHCRFGTRWFDDKGPFPAQTSP